MRTVIAAVGVEHVKFAVRAGYTFVSCQVSDLLSLKPALAIIDQRYANDILRLKSDFPILIVGWKDFPRITHSSEWIIEQLHLPVNIRDTNDWSCLVRMLVDLRNGQALLLPGNRNTYIFISDVNDGEPELFSLTSDGKKLEDFDNLKKCKGTLYILVKERLKGFGTSHTRLKVSDDEPPALSLSNIANRAGTTEGTVKSYISLARNLLGDKRSSLKICGYGSPEDRFAYLGPVLRWGQQDQLLTTASPDSIKEQIESSYRTNAVGDRRAEVESNRRRANSRRNLLFWLAMGFLCLLAGAWYALRPTTEASPVRVTYYLLGGHTIDFLADGDLGPEWDEHLGGKGFIVQNDVLKYLQELRRRHSAQLDPDVYSLDLTSEAQKGHSRPISSEERRRPFLVASHADFGLFERGRLDHEIESLSTPKMNWRVSLSQSAISDAEAGAVGSSVTFWRFGTRNDILPFFLSPRFRKWLSFYDDVTAAQYPDDFIRISVRCGSWCEGGRAYLTMPELRLKVVVLDNISSDTLSMDSFQLKSADGPHLRTVQRDQINIADATQSSEAYFPIRELRAGEKVIIPLALILKNPGSDNDLATVFNHELLLEEFAKKIKLGTAMKCLIESGVAGDIYETISGSILVELARSTVSRGVQISDYVVGPSQELLSVEVDAVDVPIREFDPKHLVLKNGFQMGSCPFVFSRPSSSEIWRNEGHILYNRYGKHREGTDEVALSNFDGSLLIRESDPETSYINEVFVELITQSGDVVRLTPDHSSLAIRDQDYLTLNQGEEILLSFDEFEEDVDGSYALIVTGYYVPW